MADLGLVNFIKLSRASGKTDEDIKNILAGRWSESDINDAFDEVSGMVPLASAEVAHGESIATTSSIQYSLKTVPQKRMPDFLVALALATTLGIFVYIYYSDWRNLLISADLSRTDFLFQVYVFVTQLPLSIIGLLSLLPGLENIWFVLGMGAAFFIPILIPIFYTLCFYIVARFFRRVSRKEFKTVLYHVPATIFVICIIGLQFFVLENELYRVNACLSGKQTDSMSFSVISGDSVTSEDFTYGDPAYCLSDILQEKEDYDNYTESQLNAFCGTLSDEKRVAIEEDITYKKFCEQQVYARSHREEIYKAEEAKKELKKLETLSTLPRIQNDIGGELVIPEGWHLWEGYSSFIDSEGVLGEISVYKKTGTWNTDNIQKHEKLMREWKIESAESLYFTNQVLDYNNREFLSNYKVYTQKPTTMISVSFSRLPVEKRPGDLSITIGKREAVLLTMYENNSPVFYILRVPMNEAYTDENPYKQVAFGRHTVNATAREDRDGLIDFAETFMSSAHSY